MFGPSPEAWNVAYDLRCRHGSIVAFALPKDFVQAVRKAAGPWVRLRMMPAVAWGAQRAQRMSSFETGWYLQEERDRAVGLWLDRGQARFMALVPHLAGDAPGYRNALAPWCNRYGVDTSSPLLVGMPTTQIPAGCSRLHAIALFGADLRQPDLKPTVQIRNA